MNALLLSSYGPNLIKKKKKKVMDQAADAVPRGLSILSMVTVLMVFL